MILQGNQRAGAIDLARHLLKEENDHVEVHELSGFVSDDLVGAFSEAYAMSKATKAKQFLFSLSLNPPIEAKVSTQDFEQAINRVEKSLGLTGQPRAIVFHEKQGRRHCHAVWSRTDTKTMTAINLPHTKRKLMTLSRDLYIEHGWEMPKGFIKSSERDPQNFTLAQWQQAKRIGKDPKAIKQAFQDSWATSDNRASFAMALKERGFILAKGDRRGFVAIDQQCEVYAISKWVGVKTKQVKAKLGELDSLPSTQAAKESIAKTMQSTLSKLRTEQTRKIDTRLLSIAGQRRSLINQHRQRRAKFYDEQQVRWLDETKVRQARFRKGLLGLWDRVSGKHLAIRRQNEREAILSKAEMEHENEVFIQHQLQERRHFQQRYQRLKQFRHKRSHALSSDIRQYHDIAQGKQAAFEISPLKPKFNL